MIAERLEPQNGAKFDNLIQEGHEKLIWMAPTAPLSFSFFWEKMQFSAKLDHIDHHHRLRILGDMGALPFSAEKPDFRERFLHLTTWDTGNPHIKFVLDPKRHHVYLMTDYILEDNLSGFALITSAITALLRLRPFIELAKEIGWQHPSASPPKIFNVAPISVKPPSPKLPVKEEITPPTAPDGPPTIIVRFS